MCCDSSLHVGENIAQMISNLLGQGKVHMSENINQMISSLIGLYVRSIWNHKIVHA